MGNDDAHRDPLGRNRIYGHVLDLLGNTPIVELRKMFAGQPVQVFGKLESYNPSGSAKDRPALNMILDGIQRGNIDSGTTIIESSSGNLAIGLATVCKYLNLKLIIVVDSKTTMQNVKLIRSYGATVEIVTEPDPLTGELLPARLSRVRELCEQNPNSYWTNQYGNPANSAAHYLTTMAEVFEILGKNVDYLFLAVSTCGTLRGCADYIRDHKLGTKIVAVDAVGSVIFGTPPGKRMLPGHGSGIVPDNYQDGLADKVVHVSDLDCVMGCRRLLDHEAIMCGALSGGIVTAAERMAPGLKPGSKCVLLLADRGERYLDTVYSDEWVERHFGALPEIDGNKYRGEHKPVEFTSQTFQTSVILRNRRTRQAGIIQEVNNA